MSANDPFAALPSDFGRYRVLKLLGQGGMGAVYLANDTKFKSRQVALKVPNQQLTGDAAARFQREADAAAILSHPNICLIHDVGIIDGRHFLAMQFVEGKPLSDLVGPGKLWSENDAIDIVVKLANALQYAHDKGVIHRDIKPLNVMMRPDGEPILMDFGLAKLAGDPALTASNAILGTPYYMSLEQARGQQAKIGPQSDLYSLGIVTFEMLTGERPFTGSSFVDIVAKIALGAVPPVRKLRPELAPQLEAVVLKATAKSRKNRYESMREFAVALAGCKQLKTVSVYPPSRNEFSLSQPVAVDENPPMIARPPSLPIARRSSRSAAPPDETPQPAPTVRMPRRTPWLPIGSAVLTVLLLVVAAWGLLGKSSSSSAPPVPPKSGESPAASPNPSPTATNETIEEFDWKGVKRTRTVLTLNLGGEMVEFVKIPAGSFQMGSPESDAEADKDEKPPHTVTFTQPLWMSKYPITKGQFAAFAKSAPYKSEAERDGEGGWGYDESTGKFEGRLPKYNWLNTGWTQTDRHPVVNVTHKDAAAYCDWATKQANRPVRLVSEAEYEYANRGGGTTRYFTGDDPKSLEGYANVADRSFKLKLPTATIVDFDDGEPFTSRVGKYKPNGFGLYDTTGNVWSWCADTFDENLYKRGNVVDPKVNENSEQKYRVLRGGSWFNDALVVRAAYRYGGEPVSRNDGIGFRACFPLDR